MSKKPIFGEFDSISYQEAINELKRADDLFKSLPAKVRRRFDDNPQNFVDFMSDEKNAEEAFELGLVEKSVQEPVSPAPAAEGAHSTST